MKSSLMMATHNEHSLADDGSYHSHWDSTNYQRSKMIRKMTVLVTNGTARKSIYHYSLQWLSYDMIAIQNFDNKKNLKFSPEIVTRTLPISEMVKPIPVPHYDLSIIELRYQLSN